MIFFNKKYNILFSFVILVVILFLYDFDLTLRTYLHGDGDVVSHAVFRHGNIMSGIHAWIGRCGTVSCLLLTWQLLVLDLQIPVKKNTKQKIHINIKHNIFRLLFLYVWNKKMNTVVLLFHFPLIFMTFTRDKEKCCKI